MARAIPMLGRPSAEATEEAVPARELLPIRSPLFFEPGVPGMLSPCYVASVEARGDEEVVIGSLEPLERAFVAVGYFVALCLLNGIVIPLSFNRHVVKILLGRCVVLCSGICVMVCVMDARPVSSSVRVCTVHSEVSVLMYVGAAVD
jgi:hypothetical protein